MTWTNINGNKIHWDGAVRANGWTDAHPRLERRLETHSPLMRYTRSTIALIYCRLRYTFFLLWRMGSGTRDPLIIDDKWPASISKRVRFFFQWAGRRDTFRRTCPCIHFFSLKALIRNSDQMPDFFFLLCLQFNFVGKLLGPRGNSMKRLQEETGVKMSILGKGSMRDKDKVGKIGFVFQCTCLAASRESSDLRIRPE